MKIIDKMWPWTNKTAEIYKYLPFDYKELKELTKNEMNESGRMLRVAQIYSTMTAKALIGLLQKNDPVKLFKKSVIADPAFDSDSEKPKMRIYLAMTVEMSEPIKENTFTEGNSSIAEELKL